MRKSYRAVSVDRVTIKSIKAKLGKNHCYKVSGSHQVGGVRKVISRFNTQKPFLLDSTLEANQFDTRTGLSV
ncbi:hypothetical protein E5P62_04890 [Helicobacter pylori]|uniref:hypothetical protein n=1 Tax=Helicobacter pylori TaxID=210 RepID=UPI000FDEA7F1|nr:hypothetical protein [Helicobacter pylori]RVZ61669.1 hypothetical protein EC569_05950 [Helicobacter pylori]WQX31255.1 hypothetical protein E5P62_04890 [Helicobacter pylori]WQY58959.1 hypothetical protein KVK92_04525 [Helicobacter pylori]